MAWRMDWDPGQMLLLLYALNRDHTSVSPAVNGCFTPHEGLYVTRGEAGGLLVPHGGSGSVQ